MKKQRRVHSAEFKAGVAMEALKGVKTVAEIAAENGVHPVQVTQWKREMQEYEGICRWSYGNLHELERALSVWFKDYNHRKPNKALEYQTPWEVYRPEEPTLWRHAA